MNSEGGAVNEDMQLEIRKLEETAKQYHSEVNKYTIYTERIFLYVE